MINIHSTVNFNKMTVAETRDGQYTLIRLGKEYLLKGHPAKLMSEIAKHINGINTLSDIGKITGENIDDIVFLMKKLYKLRLVHSTNSTPISIERITGKEFYKIHKEYVSEWLIPVYQHPLWEKIVTGSASREKILTFAFEKYHYIEAAHEHMAIAVANASSEMMPHLAKHFIEEYSHGDIYRSGLNHYYPNEIILSSQPLPSTRALINFLNESAQECSFSYYAGNELLQTTENTNDTESHSEISSFHEKILYNYPWAKPLVKSFEAHTSLDQQLGHECTFRDICADISPLTLE